MAKLLENRTAVVTGAASGIGRGIPLAFAEHGADVVVADIGSEPRESGTPIHEYIVAETDVDAVFVECDVTDFDDFQGAVDAAAAFGGTDVLVNNAGICYTNEFLEASEDEYDRTIENGSDGSIIDMSSLAGFLGNATYPVYNLSKAAVRLLTYSLASQYSSPVISRATSTRSRSSLTAATRTPGKSGADFAGGIQGGRQNIHFLIDYSINVFATPAPDGGDNTQEAI